MSARRYPERRPSEHPLPTRSVQGYERPEPSAPVVYDEAGTLITIGCKVNAGAGEPGYVTAITEPDESHGRVFVKWPEHDEPEGFIYHGTGWCWEGPDVCDEVEVVA